MAYEDTLSLKERGTAHTPDDRAQVANKDVVRHILDQAAEREGPFMSLWQDRVHREGMIASIGDGSINSPHEA